MLWPAKVSKSPQAPQLCTLFTNAVSLSTLVVLQASDVAAQLSATWEPSDIRFFPAPLHDDNDRRLTPTKTLFGSGPAELHQRACAGLLCKQSDSRA